MCHNLPKTYLTGRRHCTEINNHISSEEVVTFGIAQESVLGPLEYIFYVHSLKYAVLKAKYGKSCDDIPSLNLLQLLKENLKKLLTSMNFKRKVVHLKQQ